MMKEKRSVEKTRRDIRRYTRKKYSAEEKICIILEGLLPGAILNPFIELCYLHQ